MISVVYGKPFEVVSVSGQLAMVDRKWILGPIARIAGVPVPPWQPGELEMRATVSARKHGMGPRGDCFDSNDAVQSQWVPIPTGQWNLTFPDQEWVAGQEWEAVKVVIHTRRRGGSDDAAVIFPKDGKYVFDFASQEGVAGLRKRIGTNIFSTIERELEKCP